MDAGSIPAASTIFPCSRPRRPRAVHYTAGVDQPADILSAAPGASAPPASRWPRVLDPLAVSIALALVFTAAGLVELLTRGAGPGRLPRRRPPAHHADRRQRALAGAALVVAARQPLRLAGPPVRAVDHRLRVHAGGRVGRRRRLVRDRRLRPLAARRGGRLPGRPRLVVVLLTVAGPHRGRAPSARGPRSRSSGSSRSSSASTAAASSAPSAGPRSSRPTARRAPARRSPRSAPASPASCTTAWGTRSTWSCCTRAPRSASSRPSRSWRARRWAASRRPAGRRSATSSACSASCARPTTASGSTRRRASASSRRCASRCARRACPSP